MKEGLLGGTLSVSSRRPSLMLHADWIGVDVDWTFALVDDAGELVDAARGRAGHGTGCAISPGGLPRRGCGR